ncbi:MAG: ABC transporter ATP-binding protein [Bacillota bacterium]
MIEIRDVTKVYTMGNFQVHALRGVSLDIQSGESVAIMGPSGSGKSTMMNLLGCLDRPTSGAWLLNGEEIGKKSDNELATIRNRTVGFIFQNFNLLAKATALQNVEMPLMYRGLPGRERLRMAKEALERVGLGGRLHHKPTELSGGQQQRVAIARALVGQPQIIMADEPTGNLDSRSGMEIVTMLQEMNDQGITLIMVTHDNTIAAHCKRVVRLRDGRVVDDQINRAPIRAAESLAKLPPREEGDQ